MQIAVGLGSEALGARQSPRALVEQAHPPHPVALAQQALTAQAVADGRLTLGVGGGCVRLTREGVSGAAELALVGDSERLATELRRLAELGVTELWPVTFPIGDGDGTSTRRTRRVLAELAGDL